MRGVWIRLVESLRDDEASLFRLVAGIAICLTLAGCAGGPTSQALLEPRTIDVDTTAEPAGGIISSHIQQLQAKTSPSYVTLVVHDKEQQGGGRSSILPEALTSGSGFVVGDGLIMTAGHVAVKTGNTVDARASDGRIYGGRVVAVYPENDMALIKLRSFNAAAVTPAPQHAHERAAQAQSAGQAASLERYRPHRLGQLDELRPRRAL